MQEKNAEHKMRNERTQIHQSHFAHLLSKIAHHFLSLARLGEVIFIPRLYGIFYLTAKSLLRHRKKIVLTTWLLSGKYRYFQSISEGCNNFILLFIA